MEIDLAAAVNTVIRRRQSIYPYQYEPGEKVDDEIIDQILNNANHAPNHKRTEPWRFTVFTGEGLRRFADLQVSLVKKHNPDAGELKLKKLAEYPLLASHVIAIGMKRHEHKVPEVEEILAIGCAIQNIFLSVTAYGLVGYLSTGGITYIGEAKSYFGLSDEDTLIGFFYIGKKADLPAIEKGRGDVQDKTKWITD